MYLDSCYSWFCCFFFNDTATTEIYTLSLHDALPICCLIWLDLVASLPLIKERILVIILLLQTCHQVQRSEERFSRNAETDLVCRLLLEKKNKQTHESLTQHQPRSTET